MKVLYIGHYREGSGWSQAAIDYILSLDAVGVDVVCRPVKLNNLDAAIPKRIVELEKKSLQGSNICIQHVLPHLMDYNGRFDKCIGLFVTETQSVKYSGWPSRLNTMGELWVPNQEMVRVCRDSNVYPTCHVVPHATDVGRFKADIEPYSIEEAQDKFVFYFIGEYNRRKRVTALMQAYLKEFCTHDRVHLVLKLNKPGFDAPSLARAVVEDIQSCQNTLRKYKDANNFPTISVITEYLSQEHLDGLHTLGDCFVIPSFGEAWCIPAFDAMGHGKLVISSDVGGMKDFLGSHGLMVKGNMEPVINPDFIFDDMLTCWEDWYACSINDLAKQMRTAFTLPATSIEARGSIGRQTAHEYSYEKIGKRMLSLLEE